MDMKADDKANTTALGLGINLTALRKALPELEVLCNHKIEAADGFKNAVQVVAIQAGILPGVLSQYVTSRVNESVAKKAQSAEQLSLLFTEIS